jgi:hypothetical protein
MVLIELGDGQTTTKITPQRTGVYTIKAGGRWDRDPRSRGRRGMDLRWDNGVIIARDEKAPNSEGSAATRCRPISGSPPASTPPMPHHGSDTWARL